MTPIQTAKSRDVTPSSSSLFMTQSANKAVREGKSSPFSSSSSSSSKQAKQFIHFDSHLLVCQLPTL